MLALMVACNRTPFRFDLQSLSETALSMPGAGFGAAGPGESTVSFGTITIPDSRDGVPGSELHLMRRGDVLGLDVPDPDAGARLLALLAAVPGLPGDGSVVVVGWQQELYPLRPGITDGELLADQADA